MWLVRDILDHNKTGQHSPLFQSSPATDNFCYFEQQYDNNLKRMKQCSLTYIGGFGFSVPAVTGVMSHFVVHVLSETQFIFGNTHFSKVEVDPPNEVSQDGVIDHSLNMATKTSRFSLNETPSKPIRSVSRFLLDSQHLPDS